MGRVVRSISLPPELDQIVEANIGDFSEYVQNCVRRDFMDQEQLDKKIKEKEKEVEELKKLKGMAIVDKKNIPQKEEEFLKGAKKRVREMPGELMENCRVYNQRFGKRISMIKFRELIEE